MTSIDGLVRPWLVDEYIGSLQSVQATHSIWLAGWLVLGGWLVGWLVAMAFFERGYPRLCTTNIGTVPGICSLLPELGRTFAFGALRPFCVRFMFRSSG